MSLFSQRTLGKCLGSIPSTRLCQLYRHRGGVLAVRYQSTSSGQPPARPQTGPGNGNGGGGVQSIRNSGLNDAPEIILDEGSGAVHKVDWARSFHGLSVEPFAKEIADILLAPIEVDDVEIKPDGILYLPEIKYRRILNRAFGPGGWGLAPRGETIVTERAVTREYALVCHGRLVSVARGEQDYFDPSGIPTATEGCKSNALMRTCKDLGLVSELWDPRFIRNYKKKYCEEKFVEHVLSKKKAKRWIKKGDTIEYPFKLAGY